MKPKPFNEDKHVIPRYAHAKLDGMRLTIKRYPTEPEAKFITSNGIDLFDSLKHYEWFERVQYMMRALNSMTYVDTELTSPNGFEYIKTALKTGEPLELNPFATSALSHDAPLDDVSCWVWEHLGLSIPTYFDRVEHDMGEDPIDKHDDSQWLTFLDEHAIAQGWEGYVFKDGNYDNWLKRKPVMTIDLIVVGATDGNNANIGLLGSLVLATTCGKIVANCSGMTLNERIEMTNMWSSKTLMNRIVEVAYDRVSSKGRLRFPRFVRWREDKSASECGLDQDPKLAAFYA